MVALPRFVVTVVRIGLGTTRLTRPWHLVTLPISWQLLVTRVAWQLVTPDRPDSEQSIRTLVVEFLYIRGPRVYGAVERSNVALEVGLPDLVIGVVGIDVVDVDVVGVQDVVAPWCIEC